MLTLFRHADVFTPAPMGAHDVLVGGGRVLAIARELQAPAGVATEVVDLGGRRLIPGLVDCHVHATGGGGESGPASRVPPIVLSSLTTAGITSVVDPHDAGPRRSHAWIARGGLVDVVLDRRLRRARRHAHRLGARRHHLRRRDQRRRRAGHLGPSLQPTFDELVRIAADCHVAAS